MVHNLINDVNWQCTCVQVHSQGLLNCKSNCKFERCPVTIVEQDSKCSDIIKDTMLEIMQGVLRCNQRYV